MAEISDVDVLERYPHRYIDRDNIGLFRGFIEHRLLINRCGGCGLWFQPPWPNCPRCWSQDIPLTEVSGKGVIFTFCILHTGGARDVDYEAGHPVAVVELVEQPGLRITATIVDCAHEDIAIDMPVELTWIERRNEPIPAFRPA